MAYGSYVFNGSDELMTHDWSTSSPGTTKFTVSMWIKVTDRTVQNAFFQVINTPTNTQYLYEDMTPNSGNGRIRCSQDTTSDDWNEYTDASPVTANSTWYHIVIAYDSSDATADDRIKIYVDGSLEADSGTQPSASEPHHLFENGWQFQLGAYADIAEYLDGKIAFFEVVDGLALAPTDFAFDDSGTWTRKPYTGSYGTYGFNLNGSDGFNDVSGNGIDFTGVNMTTGDNIDTGDLPPYIASYSMTVGTGALTFAGQAVNLIKTWLPLEVGTGAFAYTGQDTTLQAIRNIAVGTGAFTFAGQDVALIKTWLPLEVGTSAFTFAGQDVGTYYGYRVAVGTGAFTFAGQNVTLRAIRTMPVGTSAFTFAGKDVGTYYGYRVAVGTGTFVFAGQDVSVSFVPIGGGVRGYGYVF